VVLPPAFFVTDPPGASTEKPKLELSRLRTPLEPTVASSFTALPPTFRTGSSGASDALKILRSSAIGRSGGVTVSRSRAVGAAGVATGVAVGVASGAAALPALGVPETLFETREAPVELIAFMEIG